MDQVTPVVEITLGTVPLIASLFIHGVGMGLVQRVFEKGAIPHYRERGHAVVYFAVMIVLMLITHLVEILMWSAVLVGLEAVPIFRDAFYYVAGTYTTLGYGEGTLPKAWRLLAPMIAISGLFAFGWTTGSLFSFVTQASLLRAQRAAVSPSRK
jgi:hypothetical protein